MISYDPMGNKCENCGKGVQYGHNVSHSKRRTRRIFKPNLHEVRVFMNGKYQKMKLCVKCLRLLKSKSENTNTQTPQATA